MSVSDVSNRHALSASIFDWVKVLRPTRHKISHFGVVLPGQSLCIYVALRLFAAKGGQTIKLQQTKKLQWIYTKHQKVWGGVNIKSILFRSFPVSRPLTGRSRSVWWRWVGVGYVSALFTHLWECIYRERFWDCARQASALSSPISRWYKTSRRGDAY